MKDRFYFDTKGNDDEAYREAIQFACQHASNDPEIKRVILLAATKQNIGWLERLYDRRVIRDLFKGTRFKNCTPIFKIETVKTYKDTHDPEDMVITLGLDEDDIFKVDSYYGVRAIIVVPWISEKVQKWIKTWNPTELRGKVTIGNFPEPSCIVKIALKELTESINMATGINSPFDEQHAKTTILALHKYEPRLDPDVVIAHLLSNLGWDIEPAKQMGQLIKTLNAGKFFKGGHHTGLQQDYKRWKGECQ